MILSVYCICKNGCIVYILFEILFCASYVHSQKKTALSTNTTQREWESSNREERREKKRTVSWIVWNIVDRSSHPKRSYIFKMIIVYTCYTCMYVIVIEVIIISSDNSVITYLSWKSTTAHIHLSVYFTVVAIGANRMKMEEKNSCKNTVNSFSISSSSTLLVQYRKKLFRLYLYPQYISHRKVSFSVNFMQSVKADELFYA